MSLLNKVSAKINATPVVGQPVSPGMGGKIGKIGKIGKMVGRPVNSGPISTVQSSLMSKPISRLTQNLRNRMR